MGMKERMYTCFFLEITTSIIEANKCNAVSKHIRAYTFTCFFVFNCVALQECRVDAGSIDVHCGCL